jgi:hypothetical protein
MLVFGVAATTGITTLIGLLFAIAKLRMRRFGGRALWDRATWIALVSALAGMTIGIIGGVAVILARLH